MEGQKRKRTENWSNSDKKLLRELCTEHIKVIENKNVNTNTNRQKKECWEKITESFNFVSEVKRDVNRVQFQWRNMKMRAKVAESSYRKSRNQTGGGPPPKSPSKEDLEIIDLIPNEFIIDSNIFDSDGAAIQDTADCNEFYEKIEYLENIDQNENDKENSVYFESTKETKKKEIKKKKLVSDSDYSNKKELFELTKAQMIEEHAKKMKVLNIEEECKLKELQFKEKQIEKIELEMKLLRNQIM